MSRIIDTKTRVTVKVSFTLVSTEDDISKHLKLDHLNGRARIESKVLFKAGKVYRSVYQIPDKYTYGGVAQFTADKSNIDRDVGLFVSFIRNLGGTAEIVL